MHTFCTHLIQTMKLRIEVIQFSAWKDSHWRKFIQLQPLWQDLSKRTTWRCMKGFTLVKNHSPATTVIRKSFRRTTWERILEQPLWLPPLWQEIRKMEDKRTRLSDKEKFEILLASKHQKGIEHIIQQMKSLTWIKVLLSHYSIILKTPIKRKRL